MEGRVSISKDSNNEMHISIADSLSGLEIIRVTLSLEHMMAALTGLHGVKADISRLIGGKSFDSIGKKIETSIVYIDKPPSFDKKQQRIWAVQKISELPEYDCWDIFDNGTTTQQPRDKHKVTMARWVD